MKVKIGELDKRIQIGYMQVVQDNEGFDKDEFKKDYSAWSSIKNKSGSEFFKSGTDFNKKVTRFLIRYRKDKTIDENMKIKYKNTIYNIIFINNYSEDNRFIEIIAEVIN